jgi:acetyl esterase/lipase
MDMMIPRVMLVALAALMASVVVADATPMMPVPKGPIPIWPGVAPGDAGDIGEEKDTTKAGQDPPGKYIIRLGNVSRPTIEVFKPPKSKDTGAAVVVCPGGGYYILAMDLEGTEVCKWLNSIGVTGVLLKYRVPIRKDRPRYAAPLQDAQRAVGLVRHNAREWGIDPSRIGILGFSAGGHLSAAASTNFDSRTYPPVDDADRESCRPDFTVLIYPAYLTAPETSTTVAPELKVSNSTPPAFIVMAEDDPVHVESAMGYALALKSAKVPVELHIYPKGGHGYGLRPSENAVTTWPARAAEWMAASGFLKPAK